MAPNKSKKRQIDKISGGTPKAATRNQRRKLNPPSENLIVEEEEKSELVDAMSSLNCSEESKSILSKSIEKSAKNSKRKSLGIQCALSPSKTISTLLEQT